MKSNSENSWDNDEDLLDSLCRQSDECYQWAHEMNGLNSEYLWELLLPLQLRNGICPHCEEQMSEMSDEEIIRCGWKKEVPNPEDRFWYCRCCNSYTQYDFDFYEKPHERWKLKEDN